MTFTRRRFMSQAMGIAAGAAGTAFLPRGWIDTRLCAQELLDNSVPGFDIRDLAKRALEAASIAGAQMADVRFNVLRRVGYRASDRGRSGVSDEPQLDMIPSLGQSATFGVRAIVNGRWGFAGATIRSPADVVRIARLAVAKAKAMSERSAHSLIYAAAPVVRDGHWETPIEIDPFAIPIGEIEQRFRDGAARARDAARRANGLVGIAVEAAWERRDRLYACTDGSTISQVIYTAMPVSGAVVYSQRADDPSIVAVESLPDLHQGQYGYEDFAAVDWDNAWRRMAEMAVRRAKEPIKSVEVGRYDLVLAPQVVANFVVPVGRALELQRALGERERSHGSTSNQPGTSFAAPPQDILGKYRMCSDLITIEADRSRPHAWGTVGWDEEGVKPVPFTLIKDGVVSNYITSRTTAPAIANWFAGRKSQVRSYGCTTRTGQSMPISQIPNLTLVPNKGTVSTEDLIKSVKRGIYVKACYGFGQGDQQQLNMQIPITEAYEIANGKVGVALKHLAASFTTPGLWRNVSALGGEASAEDVNIVVDAEDPDYSTLTGARMVPIRVNSINIVNTGREG